MGSSLLLVLCSVPQWLTDVLPFFLEPVFPIKDEEPQKGEPFFGRETEGLSEKPPKNTKKHQKTQKKPKKHQQKLQKTKKKRKNLQKSVLRLASMAGKAFIVDEKNDLPGMGREEFCFRWRHKRVFST